MRFDLIIFDNDGVLVDSEPIACSVLAQLLTDCGLPTSFDDVVNLYLGGSIGRTRSMAEKRLGRELPEDFEDRFHNDLFARYPSELRAVEGIPDLLSGLNTSFCVASSGTHRRIRESLKVTGLLPMFEGRIFSAADVERGKPEPDLFFMAASSLGAEPARCLVVEDSPIGIQAALKAGMHSVGYAGLQPPSSLAHASLAVIRNMSELGALLD